MVGILEGHYFRVPRLWGQSFHRKNKRVVNFQTRPRALFCPAHRWTFQPDDDLHITEHKKYLSYFIFLNKQQNKCPLLMLPLMQPNLVKQKIISNKKSNKTFKWISKGVKTFFHCCMSKQAVSCYITHVVTLYWKHQGLTYNTTQHNTTQGSQMSH